MYNTFVEPGEQLSKYSNFYTTLGVIPLECRNAS